MGDGTKQKSSYDLVLLLTTLALVGFGLIMLYSSSSIIAEQRFGDSLYFLKRQSIFVLLGLAVLIVSKSLPYTIYSRKLVYVLLAASFLSLVLVLLPQVGHLVGGARRWLRFGPFSLQPAEFAKLALVIYISYSLARKDDRVHELTIGYLPHFFVTAAFVGLVVLQPDLGTGTILAVLVFLLLFVAGVRLRYLAGTGLLFVTFLGLAIFRVTYRWERLLAFLNPWRDPSNTSFQLIHSLVALGSGGPLGAGLGSGQQKLFYLPEAHTDFILAVIGEEIGLLGVCLVLLIYVFLIARGLSIARRAPDRFGMYLAFGLTMIIGLQTMINAAVVMGLLPTKGLPLPLISYGGSSLLTNLTAIGILMNISRYCKEQTAGIQAKKAVKPQRLPRSNAKTRK